MSTAPLDATGPRDRLVAIDWMRGLVMVLMAVDHAGVFDAQHLSNESWALYRPGDALPAAQFATRWFTHLCAPTFVFLAGTAMALSEARRRTSGISEPSFDSDLLKRGLILLGFELFWWGPLTLQVLYAIGLSFLCMIPLRRLPGGALLILAGALIVGGEVLARLALALSDASPAETVAAFEGWWARGEVVDHAAQGRFTLLVPLLHPGVLAWVGPLPLFVLYPLLPWLAMMILGWVFGSRLVGWRESGSIRSPERVLAWCGVAGLAAFGLVRGLNGYGNMLLLRQDSSLIQWLLVSKYPPSLAFTMLELGLMALCLWGLLRFARRRRRAPSARNPLLVFGQTALFFYLLHAPVLFLAAVGLGVLGKLGLVATYSAALGVLVLMYPLCIWFRRYKAARPASWIRLI